MVSKDLLDRFWRDFQLITQDEDISFPIANPQDAARVLIKCRNWIGTFTEQLITIEQDRTAILQKAHVARARLKELENFFLERIYNSGSHSISALKSKEILQALLAFYADTEYKDLKKATTDIDTVLIQIDSDKEILENLIKRIEKTTDWLVQYLNWTKFELRTLQN